MGNFDALVLNAVSKQLLEAYLRAPKQGLLLHAPVGAGLGTTSQALAQQLTGTPGSVLTISPDEKGTIGIERVRQLYSETRARRQSKFVVVIDDA